ncbi:MAG: APC family permease [Saccharolobus sp.]|uniref:Amino acid transporter n=2 Tax=Saccharolobus shibatae TaxID=2286 RepID=A0A8F5GST9_SACSH|nr:APC family permease [Saccharolobus shibatae]MCH4815390.1 APC family permease [Saccharolobus shibatae]QXJ28229.1 putative amino acid transporter [Saccharolobus shibatae B12]QXJ34576.1 putative amino acid transporter [Saccharolobus shibatae]
MERKQVFVRETSGLIKQVSLTDAVMLNLANMSIGIALFQSISPYITQGGVLWMASLIGMFLALPQALVYTIFNRKVGRTGGDYVWISRNLGGIIGTIFAVAYLLESTAFYAIISFFSASSINSALLTIGYLNHQNTLIYVAENVIVNPYATPTLQQRLIFYGISALAFVIIVLINILHSKWGYKLVTGLGTFSILTVILAMIIIAINAKHFNSSVIPLLKDFNVTVSSNLPKTILPYSISLPATLSLLPLFALYTYPWMNAGPAVSSEFRGDKVSKFNVFFSLLITGILVTLGFLEMDVVGGYYFNLNAYPSAIYNFWAVAMALSLNPIIEWILGLGLILWNYFVLSYGVLVFSRYVFALSFDRVFPEKFSQLNAHGSPVYAHLLDITLTLLFLLIPVFSIDAAVSLYGASIVGMLYFLAVGISAIIFGQKTKSGLMKIAGILMTIYFVYLTYEAATNPLFGFSTTSGVNIITLSFVLGSFISGIIIWSITKYMNSKKGIDLSLTFKEIPPE